MRPNMPNLDYLPCIHPIVDERIEHRVSHCQPVEAQIDVLNEWLLEQRGVVVGVDEIGVVGEPTNGEDDHHHNEHLHDLERNQIYH